MFGLYIHIYIYMCIIYVYVHTYVFLHRNAEQIAETLTRVHDVLQCAVTCCSVLCVLKDWH